MKHLQKLLAKAHGLETEIAQLDQLRNKLTGDVETAVASGDLSSDQVLDKIVKLRGRLELIPAARDQREAALLAIAAEIFVKTSRAASWANSVQSARDSMARAALNKALSPLVSDPEARSKAVESLVDSSDAVKPAHRLSLAVSDAGRYYNEAGLIPIEKGDRVVAAIGEYCVATGQAAPADFTVPGAKADA